jgi:outer membrane protein assembly factor BamB
MTLSSAFAARILSCLLVLALAACGGGGSQPGGQASPLDARKSSLVEAAAPASNDGPLAVATPSGLVYSLPLWRTLCANHASFGLPPSEICADVAARDQPAEVAPDWQGHQGNAAHTGYVPVTLDPARFAPAWEWRRGTTGVLGAINAVVTEKGRVFVTDDDYFSPVTSLYALDEADGMLAWRHDFIDAPALNPPGVANGIVYAATTGHSATFLWAFRTSDGAPVFKSAFDGQWPHVLAPTVQGGRVFTNGGYFGGGVYAFDAASGARQWAEFSGDEDMSTPAVDATHAFHYDGSALVAYAVATGQKVATIPDAGALDFFYSYHGAPILGSADHIMAFSGGAFSGRASSSTEQYNSRALVNFSLAGRSVRWRTADTYLTQPAVANGVVYAARNIPSKSLDAIDESTGRVLWSWSGTEQDREFHRNVLVTRNLVFVSTDVAVHAIDLASRQRVWTYPAPGMLALSAAGMLYIVEGARESTGRLIAIRVK